MYDLHSRPMFLPMLLLFFLVSALNAPRTQAAEPPSEASYHPVMREAWIAMPDGVRLAADLYFPEPVDEEEAGSGAFP
ncbi:MAG: hypothetical protein PVJ17_09795, partial [Lysobacterales bacterium]